MEVRNRGILTCGVVQEDRRQSWMEILPRVTRRKKAWPFDCPGIYCACARGTRQDWWCALRVFFCAADNLAEVLANLFKILTVP
jgi:hypothetical protein